MVVLLLFGSIFFGAAASSLDQLFEQARKERAHFLRAKQDELHGVVQCYQRLAECVQKYYKAFPHATEQEIDAHCGICPECPIKKEVKVGMMYRKRMFLNEQSDFGRHAYELKQEALLNPYQEPVGALTVLRKQVCEYLHTYEELEKERRIRDEKIESFVKKAIESNTMGSEGARTLSAMIQDYNNDSYEIPRAHYVKRALYRLFFGRCSYGFIDDAEVIKLVFAEIDNKRKKEGYIQPS